MLSDKLSQAESDNNRLKDEVLSLRVEMHKRRKIRNETTPLRATILDQQSKLFDINMKFFHKIKKMIDKGKSIEKHLEIFSQTHQRMRDLQDKIIELEEWRSTEKKIPNSLPTIKGYDIIVYSITTEECQHLTSRFAKNARKDLAGMMDLYKKSTYDIQRYIRWLEINLKHEHPIMFTLFDQLENDYEKVKVELQAKEEFLQEDIQELLIKPSMEYSHYSTFVHKFVITMEEYWK